MADAEADHAWRYPRSVREHALSPLSTARERVAEEVAELRAEAAAFERFADRIATITPARTADAPPASRPAGGDDARERARRAYRETVMALDHYGTVYDEPLLDNVAGELGASVAAILAPGASGPFTAHLRSLVRAAAADAAERRGRFNDRVLAERESLDHARETILAITEPIDGDGPSAGQRATVERRLEALIDRRQRRLQSRAGYRHDGHDLCEYVYASEPWTYPVMTAAARLHSSVA